MTTMTKGYDSKIITQTHSAIQGMSPLNSNHQMKRDPKDIPHDAIFVGNLSYFCTEEVLASLFMNFGPVSSLSIQRSRKNLPLHYGFVDMQPADAERAISALNNVKFMGRQLRVSWRKGNTDHKPNQDKVSVHVSFLTFSTDFIINEEYLGRVFGSTGGLVDCVLKHHRISMFSHKQTGYAFLYFADEESAERALDMYRSYGGIIGGVTYDCKRIGAEGSEISAATHEISPKSNPLQPHLGTHDMTKAHHQGPLNSQAMQSVPSHSPLMYQTTASVQQPFVPAMYLPPSPQFPMGAHNLAYPPAFPGFVYDGNSQSSSSPQATSPSSHGHPQSATTPQPYMYCVPDPRNAHMQQAHMQQAHMQQYQGTSNGMGPNHPHQTFYSYPPQPYPGQSVPQHVYFAQSASPLLSIPQNHGNVFAQNAAAYQPQPYPSPRLA